MSIHCFKSSAGSWSSQSSLCNHNCCRKILYTTTTGLIKPSGSNMAATIEEKIRLLTWEILGSRNFWAHVPLLIRNWYDNGCHSKPSVLMPSLLSSSMVPSFLCNQEGLLLICWGDWHKTCVGEIPLVPKARGVLAVVVVQLYGVGSTQSSIHIEITC